MNSNRTEDRTETTQNRHRPWKKVAAASLAGAALTAGFMAVSTATAPNSHALEWPGAGDIFSTGVSIYQMAAQCKANMDNDVDCLQSTGKTIAEIHSKVHEIDAKLDKYYVTYNRDQQHSSAALSAIIKNQSDTYVRSEMQKVEADLENSHVSLKLYKNFMDCVSAATGPNAATATCANMNIFGIDQGPQPASVKAIINSVDLFLARQQASPEGIGGYTPDPALFARRIGGTTTNPYQSWSLLNSVLRREENLEREHQGLPAGTPLRLMPASYVNKVGNATHQLTTLEENYFNVRELASAMVGNDDLAQSFATLAIHGRNDESPVLSIASQRSAFSFPGWTPQNQLKDTEAYFTGPKSGVVRLESRGTSANAELSKNTPSEQQVEKFAEDIGGSETTYSKLSALYPDALPKPDGQQVGNPTAAGRLWTAPQDIDMTTLRAMDGPYSLAVKGTDNYGAAIGLWGRRGQGSFGTVERTAQGSVPFQILNAPSGAASAGTATGTRESWSFNPMSPAWAVPVTRMVKVHKDQVCRIIVVGRKPMNRCKSAWDGEFGAGHSVLASIVGDPTAGPAIGLLPAANIDFVPQKAGGVLQAESDQG